MNNQDPTVMTITLACRKMTPMPVEETHSKMTQDAARQFNAWLETGDWWQQHALLTHHGESVQQMTYNGPPWDKNEEDGKSQWHGLLDAVLKGAENKLTE